MAPQLRENHPHAGFTDITGKFLFDKITYLRRCQPPGLDITDERNRDHAIRPDGNSYGELRVPPHAYLNTVIDADLVFTLGNGELTRLAGSIVWAGTCAPCPHKRRPPAHRQKEA